MLLRIASIVGCIALPSLALPAEFRGITASEITETSPYQSFGPIVRVTALSGDGSTIGGSLTQTGVDFDCATFDCYSSAFVWSHEESQRRSLGELQTGPIRTAYPKSVEGLTYDGSTALVTYEYRHYESALHQNEAAVLLRADVVIGEWLAGADVSASGATVVGTLSERPFLWTADGGLANLSGIDAESEYYPGAISGDGSTVVLTDIKPRSVSLVSEGSDRRNAARWTELGGLVELTPLDGSVYSFASAVSHDGSVIAGASKSRTETEPETPQEVTFPLSGGALASIDVEATNASSRATVWRGGQPELLEVRDGYSQAVDVSADGTSLVGFIRQQSPQTDASSIPKQCCGGTDPATCSVNC